MYFMFRTGCIIPSASLDCKWDAAYRLLRSLEEFKVSGVTKLENKQTLMYYIVII